MVDKYLTREEILRKYYKAETQNDWDDPDFCVFLYFMEGGKKIIVQRYWSVDEYADFYEEDAIAHWLSMGRTWDEEDFFEPRPDKSVKVLKMRDEDY